MNVSSLVLRVGVTPAKEQTNLSLREVRLRAGQDIADLCPYIRRKLNPKTVMAAQFAPKIGQWKGAC
jgi:hypothetical protein